jgi:hypothetical protein
LHLGQILGGSLVLVFFVRGIHLWPHLKHSYPLILNVIIFGLIL